MSKDKYDRQIRLWGEGQHLISNVRILCFNSDGASTETLKNLILAGVGFISLVDDKKIDSEDLLHNFFIDSDDIGKSRAEVSLKNLLELNSDSKGNFFNLSGEEFLENFLLELSTYDLVIVANKQDSFINKIISQAEFNNQRVAIIKNFGLINYLRIYENFHASFKLGLPDNPVIDMRIANPFTELEKFCDDFNLDDLEEIDHKHVPYVIILIKAVQVYKNKNNGTLPSSAVEKSDFKEIINSMRKFKDSDNFDEALNFYYYANKDKLNIITNEIQYIFDLMNENNIESLLKNTNIPMSNFFILCKALSIFYKHNSTLPVVGSLPDMKSDTETYIKLKKLYEKKSQMDREEVKIIVLGIIKSLNDESLSLKKEQILSTIFSEEMSYLELICKNWPQINLIKYSNIVEEDKGYCFGENDYDEHQHKTNKCWYILIKSSDYFYSKFNRFPGETKDHKSFVEDIPLLKQSVEEYINKNNLIEKLHFKLSEISDNFYFEFCRMSNSKIVPTISIISSITSQEIIKLITYQFNTINNTLIYNGIDSTLSVFKF